MVIDEASGQAQRDRGDRRPIVLAAGAVFAVALLMRLGITAASKGGFGGSFGYDPGVYYSAADSLLSGRLPYRDFLLLHPPALMLALTPFAAFGRLTSDHTGQELANIAWSVLGAGGAALIVGIVYRLRWSVAAAVTGGLFYALWFGSASVDVSARLEPLGNATFLLALFLLAGGIRGGGDTSRRARLVAGLLLGVTLSVKIWWIVPVLVVLAMLFVRRDRRNAVQVLVATAVAAVLVDGPFFVLAPKQMWRMVVTDQLARPPGRTGHLVRIADLASLDTLRPSSGHGADLLVAAVCLVLAVVLLLAARRAPGGWFAIVIALSQLIVLGVSPTYFPYYADFAAGGLALLVAAAAHGRLASPGRIAATIATVAAAAVTVAILIGPGAPVSSPFPRRLATEASTFHCLMSDTNTALIQLDALSRDLEHGCRIWVDVSGLTYDRDAATGYGSKHRVDNRRWQRDIRCYLLSGNGYVLDRNATGLSPATRRYLDAHSTLNARSDRVSLRRVVRRRS